LSTKRFAIVPPIEFYIDCELAISACGMLQCIVWKTSSNAWSQKALFSTIFIKAYMHALDILNAICTLKYNINIKITIVKSIVYS